MNGSAALIRNNVWKGFTAYASASNAKNGCCYVGNGLKNNDFTFM